MILQLTNRFGDFLLVLATQKRFAYIPQVLSEEELLKCQFHKRGQSQEQVFNINIITTLLLGEENT